MRADGVSELGLTLPVMRAVDEETAFLRFPVLAKDKAAVLDEAVRRGVELGDWFVSPVHPNLEGWEKAGYAAGSCPNSESLCRRIINLPLHRRIGAPAVRRTLAFLAGAKEKGWL